MKKPLERTKRPVLRRNKEPLGFIQPMKSPTADIKSKIKGRLIENTITIENEATYKAFIDGAKEDSKRQAHEDEGYGADYCVIVFQDRVQVNEFLTNAGYPDPLDMFVDGTVLAEILGIKISDTDAGPRQLKRTFDSTLTSLSLPFNKK